MSWLPFLKLDVFSGSNHAILPSLICLFGAVFCALGLLRVLRQSKPDDPPVYPYWIPWLGHAIAMFKDSVKLHAAARAYFGSLKPYTLRVAGETWYIVSAPEDVKAVYRNSKSMNYEPIIIENTSHAFGLSQAVVAKLLHEVGEKGSLVHNSHTFFASHLTTSARVAMMGDRTLHALDGLVRAPDGGSAPMYNWCRHVVFDAVCDAVYGPTLRACHPDLFDAYVEYDDHLDLLLYRYPEYMTRRVRAARTRLFEIFERYGSRVDEVREQAMPMIWERQQDMIDAGMTNDEASDCQIGVFWALHTNSVKASFWMLMYLLSEPDLLARVRAEVDSAFPHDSVDATLPDLEQLLDTRTSPILNAALQETLRIASASTSVRMVTADTPLAGRVLRAGGRVMMPSLHLHRAEDFWGEAPDAFRAERWLGPGSLGDAAAPQGYFRPFGGGMTYCPGRFFVRREILGFVALMLRRFELRMEGQPVVPDVAKLGLGVLEPTGGAINLRLHFEPRSAKIASS